ncbi:MAG: transglutaminase domain-containing protein [Planctomycetota bacterium]
MRRVLLLSAVALLGAVLAWNAGRTPTQSDDNSAAAPPTEPLAESVSTEPSPAATTAPEKPAAPATTPAPKRIVRRYEQLLKGRRAATLEVVWTTEIRDGKPVVKDVTTTLNRTARAMGRSQTVFQSRTVSTIYRTETGDVLSEVSVTDLAGERVDKLKIERIETGYRVEQQVGDNIETYIIETNGPAKLDAEAFLGVKIRSGEAIKGAVFTYPQLNRRAKALSPTKLEVMGHDDEGPGLKVVQTTEGYKTLWWFDVDGSVVRLRRGDTVIRRDDTIDLAALPRAPPSYSITLKSDRYLPRLFTAEEMVVELRVEADDTLEAPRVAPNPFTEVLERRSDFVRLKLRRFDNEDADTPYPVKAPETPEFRRALKATPLMEVDDPQLKRIVRHVAGEAKTAREAATKIADFVFTLLTKQSPPIGELTAKEILSARMGDCSEHARLFTALCRAGGIPARRCGGYVCIGNAWGSHAWSEIWVGEWIGADPTTNEIGTRARYIFLSREDDPNTIPAQIVAERSSIRVLKARFSDGELDFTSGSSVHTTSLNGITTADTPEGWTVRHFDHRSLISGPGFDADLQITPDQGYRTYATLGRGRAERKKFGNKDAFRFHARASSEVWFIPLGRQNLRLMLRRHAGRPAPIDALAQLLKPTLDRDDG